MPQAAAATSRDCPSSTRAIANIRRAALASRLRAAWRRNSAADRSRRVISTAISASAASARRENHIRPRSGITRESDDRAAGMIGLLLTNLEQAQLAPVLEATWRERGEAALRSKPR